MSSPEAKEGNGGHVSISDQHKEWLMEEFPALSVTEALRMSSLRGIEAAQSSRRCGCGCDGCG
ncbi:hypothetical protein [Halococcus sp. AFM35]|uniref:hypothetical protein n=1 Tax=Halococcus sp. AFM35 TaxID=3421653 RepID=UPI003EBA153C